MIGAIQGQMNIFEWLSQPFHITKPVRLIELFGGVGSQAMAFEALGVPFEHYRLVEFDKYPVASYNAIHGTGFKPTDIKEVGGARPRHHGDREVHILYDILVSVPGLISGRKATRYDKGQRYKIGATVGGREAAKRSRSPAAGASHGECTAGTRQKEYAGLSKMVGLPAQQRISELLAGFERKGLWSSTKPRQMLLRLDTW